MLSRDNKYKKKLSKMQYLTKITEVVGGIGKLLAALLGVSIFSELIFGKFLGGFSVVNNITTIVSKFGDNGFIGLLAMLLILGFLNKEK